MTHKIVVGLGLGDEAKGATVDWLCATSPVTTVIRFNGGPQAAHNVITPDGRHHTFAQFGSGTFHGVPTHLSEFMMVNPFNMYEEAMHIASLGFGDPFDITTISSQALLVTPYHRAANRLKEDRRGTSRHGSTGQGIGETRWYEMKYPAVAPRVGDIKAPFALVRLLEHVRDLYTAELGDLGVSESPEELAAQYHEMLEYMNIVSTDHIDTLLDAGDCVFEASQGVLLDELYGFNPHTTWSKTTQHNARILLHGRDAECWGLTRAYHTRHGAGPFPSEDHLVQGTFKEEHNGTGHFQGGWRIGELDRSLLNYAVRANGGVDRVSISHLDYLPYLMEATQGYESWSLPENQDWVRPDGFIRLPETRQDSYALGAVMRNARAVGYDLNETDEDAIRNVAEATGVEPTLLAYGPTWEDRKLASDRVASV